MRIAGALLTLILASAAFAEMHTDSLGPTSVTPIEVHYRAVCEPLGGHSVTREGSLIRIIALDPACVITIPIPTVQTVKLPEVLPPGEYRVELRLEGDPNLFDSTEIVVRNGGLKPFELHPSMVTRSSDVPIRVSGVTCNQPDCSDVTVRVDGQTVESFRAGGDDAVWFRPPVHNKGFADVSVQKAGIVSVSPSALYFYASPDPVVFERILFPVLFDADGAFGSKWRSEATVSNPRPWYVTNATTLGLEPCIDGDCSTLEPKHFETYGGAQPHGKLLWVPRPEAPDLALALRIRDISRAAEGRGTRVPVVRERDMVHGEDFVLLDVPLDPRYRVKVRIYMIEPVLAPVPAGLLTFQKGGVWFDLPFTMTRNDARNEPYYAEVDLPQGAAGERANVEITMPLDAIGWAFASVTNNETQQVTIVTK